jgi:hypothetical protein
MPVPWFFFVIFQQVMKYLPVNWRANVIYFDRVFVTQLSFLQGLLEGGGIAPRPWGV